MLTLILRTCQQLIENLLKLIVHNRQQLIKNLLTLILHTCQQLIEGLLTLIVAHTSHARVTALPSMRHREQ